MNSTKRRRTASGFTLIELLTVIALVAILSAMLFPTFSRARESARRISCLSNMRQIGMAFQQYTDDNDERLPAVSCFDCYVRHNCQPNGYLPGARNWALAIQPYIKNTQVYACPNDPDRAGMAKDTWRPMLLDAQWPGITATSTNEEIARAFPLSYATNPYLSQSQEDAPGNPPPIDPDAPEPRGGRSLVALKAPSKLFLFTELGAALEGGLSVPNNYGMWDEARTGVMMGSTLLWWPQGQRHLGGRNFAFCDGHVKFYRDGEGPNELYLRDVAYPAKGVFSYPTMED